MFIFRNLIYAKPQVVQNVTRIPVPCVNTSRRYTGLISMRINDIKAMAIMVVVVVEEVEEVAEEATARVPTMRHRTEVMKCR